MKKLNRKGFTLIELLAIIVILAIIMVVTIPTVLSSMGDARQSTFNSSANTVADWIEKEYTLAQLGQADAAFTGVCGNDGSTCVSDTGTTTVNIASILNAAGVDSSNYASAVVYIKSSGRACVTLTAETQNKKAAFSNVGTTTATSVGCE